MAWILSTGARGVCCGVGRLALSLLYLRTHRIEPFLLVLLPLLALVSAAVLIAWAEYNRYRFGDRERRRRHPPVAPSEVARAFGGDPQIAARLSGSKVAILLMNEGARPAGVIDTVTLDGQRSRPWSSLVPEIA